MIIFCMLVAVWLWLMVRASVAEYRYYRAVSYHEPEVWAKLGAPRYWLAPFLLWVTPSRKRLLNAIENPQVLACERRFKVWGRLFLAYVVTVLLLSIAFFKWN